MTRIIETRHDNEPWLQYWLGNVTAIDSDFVKSIGCAWLFKENNLWSFRLRLTGNVALFYNALFFVRITTIGLFFHMRLSKTHLFQCGIGWKLNGRFAILFRVQSDASSAAGVSGPNYGQAIGFDYGTH